jgi:predicted hotdog family 3-hydroxylacyl-ACP dehydratase
MTHAVAQALKQPILGAADIARLIPHHGSMCLLAQVLHYDAQSIHCTAVSHRLQDNPLRENGMLHAVCGVEYAAQAMAVHGALLSGGNQPPRGGRLASVRTVELCTHRLDTVTDDLCIHAVQIMGDSNSMVYEFTVGSFDTTLLKGRATVVLVPLTSTEEKTP